MIGFNASTRVLVMMAIGIILEDCVAWAKRKLGIKVVQ